MGEDSINGGGRSSDLAKRKGKAYTTSGLLTIRRRE